MKVGDLVKYHRAGKSPQIGLVFDTDERVAGSVYGVVDYYCIQFSDTALKLSGDHIEVLV